MTVSESANRLRDMIVKAIEDHKLTRAEYDAIIHMATADYIIDHQEKALLAELHNLIENKTVKLVP